MDGLPGLRNLSYPLQMCIVLNLNLLHTSAYIMTAKGNQNINIMKADKYGPFIFYDGD